MENLKNRVTIYQVAKAANVSLATVSRVINNQGNVTEKTKKRVLDAIERLGYKPSGVAKALATNKSTNIGVVIPSANYVYIANMLNGMNEVAKDKDYSLTLFSTNHDKQDALKSVEKVITSHVDGAIIFDDELEEKDIKQISSYSVPTVAINNTIEDKNIGSISFDYEEVFADLIRRKIKSGDGKKIYFLKTSNGGKLISDALNVFLRVVKEEGFENYEVEQVLDSYTKNYEIFMDVFKDHHQGYFIAYRDSIAASIINAAGDSGLNVPNDIEVVSLIGTKYAKIVRPTISSMFIDMQQVGKSAVTLLNEIIEGTAKANIIVIKGTYHKRQSTKE